MSFSPSARSTPRRNRRRGWSSSILPFGSRAAGPSAMLSASGKSGRPSRSPFGTVDRGVARRAPRWHPWRRRSHRDGAPPGRPRRRPRGPLRRMPELHPGASGAAPGAGDGIVELRGRCRSGRTCERWRPGWVPSAGRSVRPSSSLMSNFPPPVGVQVRVVGSRQGHLRRTAVGLHVSSRWRGRHSVVADGRPPRRWLDHRPAVRDGVVIAPFFVQVGTSSV